MKIFNVKVFRGKKKKSIRELIEDLSKNLNSLDMLIRDNVFSLMSQKSELEKKLEKIQTELNKKKNELKETTDLLELREKDNKSLEKVVKQQKEEIEDLKSDRYLKVPTPSVNRKHKQTMQLYSSGRTSNIIKKVVDDE